MIFSALVMLCDVDDVCDEHHCVECARLTDIYTNLTHDFRIAITAAAGLVSVHDLDKLQDSSLAARRTLQQHKLTHHPKRHEETNTARARVF